MAVNSCATERQYETESETQNEFKFPLSMRCEVIDMVIDLRAHFQVHLSHGRPKLELQVVAYEATVPRVVFVLGGEGGDKLLQVRHVNWIEGHAPDDQPWGDPGKSLTQETCGSRAD